MNDNDIRKLGELSHALLVSPEFKMLTDLFEQQVAVDVLSTKPNEPEKREQLYATLQGMRAFNVHMAGFAEAYARTQTIQTDDGTQDHDDPGVHDIYDES